MEQKTESKTEIKIPNLGFIGLGNWKLGSEMLAKSRTGSLNIYMLDDVER
jgi:hypothetical protein